MSAETVPAQGSGGRPDRHPPAFVRRTLHHETPGWVKPGALFFITMCGDPRGENQFCRTAVAPALLESARFYHDRQRWFVRLLLIMPDHIHALLAFPATESMGETIRQWKSYAIRRLAVRWQRGFFDHRLRNDEQWQLKAKYIRENPVRKGLVADAAPWPYVIGN